VRPGGSGLHSVSTVQGAKRDDAHLHAEHGGAHVAVLAGWTFTTVGGAFRSERERKDQAESHNDQAHSCRRARWRVTKSPIERYVSRYAASFPAFLLSFPLSSSSKMPSPEAHVALTCMHGESSVDQWSVRKEKRGEERRAEVIVRWRSEQQLGVE
jgi:hypothetical protein